MSVEDYVKVAWRRKWFILLPFVLISAGVALWANLQPDIYRSSTLILVEPQRVPADYVKPTVASSIEERLSTISQQIMSRTRLQRIIDDFHLYPAARGAKAPEEIIEIMRQDIELQVKGKNSFAISYQGQEPRMVMMVANQLASFFIEENLRVREQQAEGTREFLESQLKQLREKLMEQERAVQAYKEHYMGELPSQQDANLRMVDQLQLQLQGNQETLRGVEERKFLVERQLAGQEPYNVNVLVTPGKEPGAAPKVMGPHKPTRLEVLKSQLAVLRSTYSDKYPDVLQLQREIADEERRLAAVPLEEPLAEGTEGGAGEKTEKRTVTPNPYHLQLTQQLSTLKAEIRTLHLEADRLRQQISVYRAKVETAPRREQELTILTRDYDTTRRSYQALLNKRMNAQVAENLERRQKGEQFRVLDPANFPEKPFQPNRPRLILMGVLMGLGAGLGLAFLREYLDRSLRDVDELKEYTQLP
ncbi:MAG: hypothetical protein HYY20_02910, partial [Candidatus Tectomicrobia bacterium]|nr:hypothetical protein [Candidatus Tectomicrobia bacterium]